LFSFPWRTWRTWRFVITQISHNSDKIAIYDSYPI
jgi:hypothetical protein